MVAVYSPMLVLMVDPQPPLESVVDPEDPEADTLVQPQAV